MAADRASVRGYSLSSIHLMWCEHCRQNVAGMLSQTQDSVCCSRCGQALAGNVPGEEVRATSEGATTPVADAPGSPKEAAPPCPALPRSTLESWHLDEDLRHIERLLRRDSPRVEAPAWHAAPPRVHTRSSAAPSGNQARPWWVALVSAVSWFVICAGLAATVCSIIL